MTGQQRRFSERLRESIATLFRGGRAGGATGASIKRYGAAPRGTLEADKGRSAEEELRAQLIDKGRLSAGGIQMIGLGRVQERLGDRWPHFADKAHNIARKIIERRLAAVDVYAPYGDNGYVIVFGELPKEAAELKCAIMAEEIVRTLVGEEATAGMIEVKSIVVEVDGTLLAKNIDVVDAIAGLFETMDAGEAARAKVASMEAPPAEISKETAIPDAPATTQIQPALPEGLEFVYRPIWDVRLEAALTSHCLPARAIPEEGWATGHDMLGNEATQVRTAELDLAVLSKMLYDLDSLSRRGRRQPLACSLHLDTLTCPASWEAIIELCRSIPKPLRAYTILEVVGISDSIPQARLIHLLPALRPFCRSLVARARLEQSSFSNFHHLAIDVVSADPADYRGPKALAFMATEAFVRATKDAGFRSAIHGAREFSLAARAVSAGVDYIDGDAILPVSRTLQPARRLRLADLG